MAKIVFMDCIEYVVVNVNGRKYSIAQTLRHRNQRGLMRFIIHNAHDMKIHVNRNDGALVVEANVDDKVANIVSEILDKTSALEWVDKDDMVGRVSSKILSLENPSPEKVAETFRNMFRKYIKKNELMRRKDEILNTLYDAFRKLRKEAKPYVVLNIDKSMVVVTYMPITYREHPDTVVTREYDVYLVVQNGTLYVFDNEFTLAEKLAKSRIVTDSVKEGRILNISFRDVEKIIDKIAKHNKQLAKFLRKALQNRLEKEIVKEI